MFTWITYIDEMCWLMINVQKSLIFHTCGFFHCHISHEETQFGLQLAKKTDKRGKIEVNWKHVYDTTRKQNEKKKIV